MKLGSAVVAALALVCVWQQADAQNAGTVSTAGSSGGGRARGGRRGGNRGSSAGSSAGAGGAGGGAGGSGLLSVLKASKSSNAYHMTPVRAIHARAQSDAPKWDKEGQRFISSFGKDTASGYLSAMDSVNTASVEGALMYVQAEGINYNTRSSEERCNRKNKMNYIVFYEVVVAQTNESLALYQDSTDTNEYGPMVPMDGGRCTPISGSGKDEVFPKICYYYNGDNGEPNIGPMVGGESKESDPRAPYPGNIWFSFPNTCPLKTWKDKDKECRGATRHGLCADMGAMPDGVSCTYNYRILGYIPIDDVVGITSMVSNSTGQPYGNFTEFCKDGGVEFKATEDGKWEQSIPFWEKPQDTTANAARAEAMVAAYQNLTSGSGASSQVPAEVVKHMLPLPTVEELTAGNPPCYLNVKKCNSDNGCKRTKYSQICVACESKDASCTVPKGDFTFPTLAKAVGANGETGDPSAATTGSKSGKGKGSKGGAGSKASLAPPMHTTSLVAAMCFTWALAVLH